MRRISNPSPTCPLSVFLAPSVPEASVTCPQDEYRGYIEIFELSSVQIIYAHVKVYPYISAIDYAEYMHIYTYIRGGVCVCGD